jgi:hypothetical protein
MRQKLIGILMGILILSLNGSITAKAVLGKAASPYDLPRSPFRYAIVRNEVAKTHPVRQVGILMEEGAFTEENLRFVYQLVVKRFPEPYEMDIWVYTSLVDVPTPEEVDAGGRSEMKNPPPVSGRPTAVSVRNDYNEYINYYYPTPKGQENGRIVIRAPEKQNSK